MKKSSPPKDIDDYLSRVPEPARSTMEKIREAIRAVVPPEATEAISYQMPAFKSKAYWFTSPPSKATAASSLPAMP